MKKRLSLEQKAFSFGYRVKLGIPTAAHLVSQKTQIWDNLTIKYWMTSGVNYGASKPWDHSSHQIEPYLLTWKMVRGVSSSAKAIVEREVHCYCKFTWNSLIDSCSCVLVWIWNVGNAHHNIHMVISVGEGRGCRGLLLPSLKPQMHLLFKG